jgi:hypothetical protein
MSDWCLTPKSNLSTISYIEIVWYCLLLFSKLNTVYLNFAVILQKHPISGKTYCSSSQKIVGLISGQNQTKEYKTGICCFSSKYEALPINSCWFEIRIMCPNISTKQVSSWSRKKRTDSLSACNVIQNVLPWRYTHHSLINILCIIGNPISI